MDNGKKGILCNVQSGVSYVYIIKTVRKTLMGEENCVIKRITGHAKRDEIYI